MAQLLQHGINRISIAFASAFTSMLFTSMLFTSMLFAGILCASILSAANFVLIGIGVWTDRMTAAVNTDRIWYGLVGIGVVRHYLQVCAALLLFLHHARNAVHRVVRAFRIRRVCES